MSRDDNANSATSKGSQSCQSLLGDLLLGGLLDAHPQSLDTSRENPGRVEAMEEAPSALPLALGWYLQNQRKAAAAGTQHREESMSNRIRQGKREAGTKPLFASV